jgi:hypothetical protein
MKWLRISHWLGLVAACLPIPFGIEDAIKMRLWDEPLWAAFAVAYTVALGAILFFLVQGGVWVFRRLALRSGS